MLLASSGSRIIRRTLALAWEKLGQTYRLATRTCRCTHIATDRLMYARVCNCPFYCTISDIISNGCIALNLTIHPKLY